MPAPVPSTQSSTRPQEDIRGPELGPALKRDMVLQRVRAARKRLSPISTTVPRLR
jgi:hypothetical protein